MGTPQTLYRIEGDGRVSLPVDWRQSDLLGEASLVIALAPPWWRRGEVIGLGILGLASVIYGFYLWRTASYRRRQRQLNTVIDRRTRELRDKNLALQQASQEREALMRQLEYLPRQPRRADGAAEPTRSRACAAAMVR